MKKKTSVGKAANEKEERKKKEAATGRKRNQAEAMMTIGGRLRRNEEYRWRREVCEGNQEEEREESK